MQCTTVRTRRPLAVTALLAASLLAGPASAQIDVTQDEQVQIAQKVAEAVQTVSAEKPGDENVLASAISDVTQSLVGDADAKKVPAIADLIVTDAINDGASPQAIGQGMAQAAVGKGGPVADGIADGVGISANASTIAAFNQNALASNTREGSQLAQETGEEVQSEQADRHEQKKSFEFRNVIIGSNGMAGGPYMQNQEVNALSPSRAPDEFYLPRGVPLGAPFRLYPNLLTSLTYDDNVYRVGASAPGGKTDSFFFTINPTIVLDYDTSGLKVDLYGDSAIYEYTSLGRADTTTYDLGVRGSYTITHAASFSGNVSESLEDEELSSPNDVGSQAHATQFSLFDGSGRFDFKPSRLGFAVGGSADLYTFHCTALIGGGLSCLDHDRDNQLYKGYVETSYDFSPGYSVFARGTYNDDHYFINPLNPNGGDRNGDLRSSHGYTIDTGLNLLLTNLLSAQLYVGYLDQMYIKHQPHPLPDVSGLDFGANLNWYPTELLTVHLSALRQIENIVLPGASAGDDKSVTLSAEYEIARRIFATGSVGYDDVLYKMLPPPSLTDQTFSAGLGAKWLVSHYLTASVSYNYSIRGSTRPGGSYNDNMVSLAVNLQI